MESSIATETVSCEEFFNQQADYLSSPGPSCSRLQASKIGHKIAQEVLDTNPQPPLMSSQDSSNSDSASSHVRKSEHS